MAAMGISCFWLAEILNISTQTLYVYVYVQNIFNLGQIVYILYNDSS